ncbi:hypothetical protein MRX96_017292 [Rhipicephalus microplus]
MEPPLAFPLLHAMPPRRLRSVAKGGASALVCELHFHPEDITLETSYTDDSTGRTVTAPLATCAPTPRGNSVDIPDCPKYLTSQRSARDAPEATRLRLESSALQKALQQSAEIFQHKVEEDRIQSLKDLADYVRCNSSAFWHAIEANERLILLHIVDEDAPSIKYSVTIKPDLSVLFHCLKVPTPKLRRNISIPDVASEKREIVEVLEAIEKWDHDLISTANTSKGDTVETVRALLAKLCEKAEEDDVPTITFLIEQLNLLSEKKDTLSKMTDVIPVLVYVARYCVYSSLRRLKCEKCRNVLTIDKEVTVFVEDPKYELVKELNRGELVHPSIFAVNAVAHSYAVVDELSGRDDFLTIPNQRQVATDLTIDLLTEDKSSDFDGCDAGHTKEIVPKKLQTLSNK